MTEQRITFETAVLAKEKGFEEEVKNAFVNFKIDEDINTIENSSPEEFYYAKNHNSRENIISM